MKVIRYLGLSLILTFFVSCVETTKGYEQVLKSGAASAQSVETNVLKLQSLNSCSYCNLSGANIGSADLRKADLSEAKLSNADIWGAKFCKTITPWGIDDTGC